MLHKNKMQQTSFDEELQVRRRLLLLLLLRPPCASTASTTTAPPTRCSSSRRLTHPPPLSLSLLLQTLGQTHNEAAQRTGAEGAARLSQAEVQLKSVKAETEKELSAISTKVGIECRQLEADAGLAVESTLTEAAVINDKLVANGRVDAADIVNTARRDADTALAEAQLTAARNASQATILIAEAEGTAAPMLAAQKTYQSEKAKIEVLQALGGNKDVVVSASDDPTAGKLLLVDAILQKGAERERRGDATSSRSQMLAEMFVMQEGSRVTLNMPAEYSGERR